MLGLWLVAFTSQNGFGTPPPEFEKLESSYKKKIATETKPVVESFQSNLLRQEKLYASRGNLEDALKIREYRGNIERDGVTSMLSSPMPTSPPELKSSVEWFLRQYKSRTQAWNRKYKEELRKLERSYITDQRLEDALVVRNAKLAFEKTETEILGLKTDGALDLNKELPGRTYSYELEEGEKRKITFLEKGRANFSVHPRRIFSWKVGTKPRRIILEHPDWSSKTILEFAPDGKSFDGRLEATGKKREGVLLEPAE